MALQSSGSSRIDDSKDYKNFSENEGKDTDNYLHLKSEAKESYRSSCDSKIQPNEVESAFLTPKIISNGMRILEMNMNDYFNAKQLWSSTSYGEEDELSISGCEPSPSLRGMEMIEEIPKEILQCKAVSREIRFSSKHTITQFRLLQRIILHGQCIEEWNFQFGFVIPGSTNTWQQVIEAAPVMIPVEQLSGHVIFETSFYDGDEFLCKNMVRIFYI